MTETAFISINQQARIRSVDQGDADKTAILFFNGASLPLEFWDPLMPSLAEHYRCIRFDQRNAGDSDFTGSFTLNDIAADAAAVLASKGIEQVIAAGHAWGGRVAQVFVRDYPHLVRGLVVCGTGGALPPATDPATLKKLQQAAQQGHRQAWEDALHSTFCAVDFRYRDAQGFSRVSELLWGLRTHDARWDARVSPSPSYWGRAHVPTQLIYGAQDKNGTPENAHHLLTTLTDGALVTIKDAGHFLIQETPDPVANTIINFITRLNATP